ncbi:MAG: DUF1059 domain-containing protein [Actinomycetota bacterium]
MKEVTCMCGWQTRGTEDEIVAAIQEHGEQVHGRRPTREEGPCARGRSRRYRWRCRNRLIATRSCSLTRR